jgi:hypothetical protein
LVFESFHASPSGYAWRKRPANSSADALLGGST